MIRAISVALNGALCVKKGKGEAERKARETDGERKKCVSTKERRVRACVGTQAGRQTEILYRTYSQAKRLLANRKNLIVTKNLK